MNFTRPTNIGNFGRGVDEFYPVVRDEGEIYTLYLTPNINGTYSLDQGNKQLQLSNDQKTKLENLISDIATKGTSGNTLLYDDSGQLNSVLKNAGGSRRRRPSRKYKKSAKRVFRKKSRSTRRR